jgi:hypothetical protein
MKMALVLGVSLNLLALNYTVMVGEKKRCWHQKRAGAHGCSFTHTVQVGNQRLWYPLWVQSPCLVSGLLTNYYGEASLKPLQLYGEISLSIPHPEN